MLFKKQTNKEEKMKKAESNKLKQYLEKKKKRQEEAQIEKRETISCPDCGSDLYEGGNKMDLCICYGNDWGKKIKIIKNESNIKMKFPKTMDTENIEMLLKTLKNINKE